MGFDKDKDYLESQFLPEKGAGEPPSSPPPPRQETHYEPYRKPKKRFSGWRVICSKYDFTWSRQVENRNLKRLPGFSGTI